MARSPRARFPCGLTGAYATNNPAPHLLADRAGCNTKAMVEEADAEAIGELAERLFAALERLTGWRSQEARSATLEVVKDGSGIAVYIKGKYAGRDLGAPKGG